MLYIFINVRHIFFKILVFEKTVGNYTYFDASIFMFSTESPEEIYNTLLKMIEEKKESL